jgi:16S rRNA (cytidine1402-2'-O)-methyltransferase
MYSSTFDPGGRCSTSNALAMPLFFVPTPLGNLRDITIRALDVLASCDLLVAEDTRVARKLLSALNLPGKEIWSYHERNARAIAPRIIARAHEHAVAVTSDAGMPGISDPGSELVSAARKAGIAVHVLPGPSAAIAVALLSGFPLHRFTFEGFTPRTVRARREAFARALQSDATSIWYESPRRIAAALADLQAIAPEARVFLVREYTKLHEEQLIGTPLQVAAALHDPIRGEVAFALAPGPRAAPRETRPSDLAAAIDALSNEGLSVPAIAKTLSERGLGERRAIYARASERKRTRRVRKRPQR